MPGPSRLASICTASIAIAVALSACSDAEEEPQTPMVGLPNPAAVFCDEQGGSYDAASGMCTLADGTEIDGWKYFREANESKSVGKPNPAAAFCNENGSYNLDTGECTLKDGSVVDAWQYFRDKHSS